jgi:hypothetical protein
LKAQGERSEPWVRRRLMDVAMVFPGSPARATERVSTPEIPLVMRHAVTFPQVSVLLLEAEREKVALSQHF